MWGWISGGRGVTKDLPFSLGEETGQCLAGKSVWKLFKGNNKSTGEPVSIFKFEILNAPPDQVKVAKAAFKRLRTLRHPNILKYVDGVDNDQGVYIVTEPVTPLLSMLEGINPNSVTWGIHQVLSGLKFLHIDCSMAHNNIYTSSIFVNSAGEWKLGGVAYCAAKEAPAELPLPCRVHPYLSKYEPPERLRGTNTDPLLSDLWFLGVMFWEVFNNTQMSALKNLKETFKLPGKLTKVYCECVSANPRSRPSPQTILTRLSEPSSYFDNNFVKANQFLNELQIKEPREKQLFFATLSNQIDDFPPEFCKHRVLPQLLAAFEFGGGGIDILPPLFKLGKLLDETEYKAKIVPCIIKLFSSPDRAMRIHLLNQLDVFIQYLDTATIDTEIFPPVSAGFADTVPAMRECTVKSMLLLVPKLSENIIDNQLLKHLAKCQVDSQPPIRTNTTICLSKIAVNFSEATRRKVLVPAFVRALKDPFVHARHAALLSLCCTAQYYAEPDIANRILPAVCPTLIDPERTVREQSIKTVKLFVKKLKNAHEGKVEPLPERPPQAVTTQGLPSAQGSPSAAVGASTADPGQATWAGWAMSSAMSGATSIASKYYKKEGETETPPPAAVVTQPVQPPVAVKAPSVKEESIDGDDNGWDEWQDIETPATKKSGLKLSAQKKATVDDNDFINNVLAEERSMLGPKTASNLGQLVRNKPNDPPAPWDAHKAKPKASLAPWDTPNGSGSNKTSDQQLLSSYFGDGSPAVASTDSFFNEMGVTQPPVKEQSYSDEWGSIVPKTAAVTKANSGRSSPAITDDWGTPASGGRASPAQSWDDDWGTPVVPNKGVIPNKGVVPKTRPKLNKQAVAKPPVSKPLEDGWGEDWGAAPVRSASPKLNPQANMKSNSPKVVPKADDWGGDWGAPVKPSVQANIRSDSPKVAPKADDWGGDWGAPAPTKPPAQSNDWGGDNWESNEWSKPESREDKRKQQAERRAQRSRGRGGRGGGGGFGGAKKD